MENQGNQPQPQQPLQPVPGQPAQPQPVYGGPPQQVAYSQPQVYQQPPMQPAAQPMYSAPPTPQPQTSSHATNSVFRIYYLAYYFAGLLDVLLTFRFFFLLIGANPSSGFVSFIYALTNVFVAPFENIVPTATAKSGTVTSTFDAGILVALIVYSLAGWGLARLLHAVTAGRTPRT